jgi:hypothetical protein
MMYELKMMNGDIYEISKETALSLNGKSGLIGIKEMQGFINLSSVVSITPKGLARTKESSNRRTLHDGSTATLKFGNWIDDYSGATIDTRYYPELLKDVETKQLPDGKSITQGRSEPQGKASDANRSVVPQI